jgi:signal peptide peptidase SppA
MNIPATTNAVHTCAPGGLVQRLMSSPWAMESGALAALTHRVVSQHPETVRAGAWEQMVEAAKPRVQRGPGWAVLPIWGVLGRAWSDEEKVWYGCVDVDDVVRAASEVQPGVPLVLWFRSPGGVAIGIEEMAEWLREERERRLLVAFTDEMCCSAAYWLAAQCPRIVATPSAALGSIGVYLALYDWTEYLAKAGIKLELFKAGRMKAMGLPGNPLSDEERAKLQGDAEECYALFTSAVLANRDVSEETMQGQCLRGPRALAANLCDAFVPSADAFFASRWFDTAAGA